MASPGCPVPPLCPASLQLCLSCHWVIPLFQLRVFSRALLDAGFKSGFVGLWEVVSITKSVSSVVSERPCLQTENQMRWRVIEQDAQMGLWLPHQHAHPQTHICATPTCTPTDTHICTTPIRTDTHLYHTNTHTHRHVYANAHAVSQDS